MTLLLEARQGLQDLGGDVPLAREPIPNRFDVLNVISYSHGSPSFWNGPLTLVFPNRIDERKVLHEGEIVLAQKVQKDPLNGRAITLEPFKKSPFSRLGVKVENPDSAVSAIVFREGHVKDAIFNAHARIRYTKRYGEVIPRTKYDILLSGVIAESGNSGSEFIPVGFDMISGRKLSSDLEDQAMMEKQVENAQYFFNGLPDEYSTPITTLISQGERPISR